MGIGLVATRSARDLDNGSLSWLVASSDRGLGLEDCGCGEPVEYRVLRTDPAPMPLVISLIFGHQSGHRCQLAFDYSNFQPLTYQEYCRLIGVEPEYYEDE